MKTTIQQFEEIVKKVYPALKIEVSKKWDSILVWINKNFISINDLLFWKSWFLESLIWKFDWSHYMKNPRDDRWCIVWDYSCNSSETDYHKIQLVLLSSDEDRMLYIIYNIA